MRRLFDHASLEALLGHPVADARVLCVDADGGVWVAASAGGTVGSFGVPPDTPVALVRLDAIGTNEPTVKYAGPYAGLETDLLHEVAQLANAQSSLAGLLPVFSPVRPALRMWTTFDESGGATLWGGDGKDAQVVARGPAAAVLSAAPHAAVFLIRRPSTDDPRTARYAIARCEAGQWTTAELSVDGNLHSPIWYEERLFGWFHREGRQRPLHFWEPASAGPIATEILIPNLGTAGILSDPEGKTLVLAGPRSTTSYVTHVYEAFPPARRSELIWHFAMQTKMVRGGYLVSERREGREAKSLQVHHTNVPIGREICTGPGMVEVLNRDLGLPADRPLVIRRSARSDDGGIDTDVYAFAPIGASYDEVEPLCMPRAVGGAAGDGVNEPIPLM